MPSPFPGMNPYIESPAVWHGFHLLYIARMHEALVAQVRPKYVVKTQESLFVQADSQEDSSELPWRRRRRRVAEGDVVVASPSAGQADSWPATAAVAAPVYAALPQPRIALRHRWLEVRDRAEMRLVTAVELLSPTNKRRGRDRRQYERKRLRLIDDGVNFVEIDLLRGGPRLPLGGMPPCDYYAMVSRPDEWPRAGVWPVGLRDPLPTIPVPLRPPDADATLDLQALLHRVYDAAGYADYVYQDEPDPPLPPQEQAWAERVVEGTGPAVATGGGGG